MKAIKSFLIITILVFGSLSMFAQTDTSRTKYNRDTTNWQDKNMNESRDINNRDMDQQPGQEMDRQQGGQDINKQGQDNQNKNVNSQDREQKNLNQGVYDERSGADQDTRYGGTNQERTDAPGKARTDIDFVSEATSGSMMELEASRLALEKATNARVRNFANMIIKDHQKSNTELNSVSSRKNWTVPMELKEKHQNKVQKLKDESGNDFDRKYMDLMVEDHQEDLDLYKKQATDAKDAELRSYAAKTVPVLQMHLDSAKAIKHDLEKDNKMFKNEDKDQNKYNKTNDKSTKDTKTNTNNTNK